VALKVSNLNQSSIFNLITEQIKKQNATISSTHTQMLKRRIEKPEISEWLKGLAVNKKLKVIELGCSFGFLAVAEFLFGKFDIKYWKGYDCDQTAIKIANNLKSTLNLNNCEFIHSAVTSYKRKFVYSNVQDLLSSRISKTKTKSFFQRVPNIHYNVLPECDILLIDVEGEEININLDNLKYNYCLIETNTKQATDRVITDYMSNTKNFKIIQNYKLSNYKNTFLIKKKT